MLEQLPKPYSIVTLVRAIIDDYHEVNPVFYLLLSCGTVLLGGCIQVMHSMMA